MVPLAMHLGEVAAVYWLYGGYFCGWYVLLGVGFVRWLTQEPSHRESWWMIAFGAVAYFLLIPSMLFGLMPVLEKLSARAEPARLTAGRLPAPLAHDACDLADRIGSRKTSCFVAHHGSLHNSIAWHFL